MEMDVNTIMRNVRRDKEEARFRRPDCWRRHRTMFGFGVACAVWLFSRKRGCYGKIAALGAGAIAMWLLYRRRTKSWPASENRAVLITGCDSGMGFCLALHTHRMGLTVIAAFLSSDGDGAKQIKDICGPNRLFIIEMDISTEDSVRSAVSQVEAILQDNPNLEFKALVNNTGVMVFGEFEWQSEFLVLNQVEMNFLGTMRVTKAFISFMRLKEGRIINVTSHCSHVALPGLAVFEGTKAALRAWSDGLRTELGKYDIAVVYFEPGTFCEHKNLMRRQTAHMLEMANEMAVESRLFYDTHLSLYNEYVLKMFDILHPVEVVDTKMYLNYEDALLSLEPRPLYEHGHMRYKIYYFLVRICPALLRYHCVQRILSW